MLCSVSSCPVPHFVFPSLVSFHSSIPPIKASQLSGHLVTLHYTTWSPASHFPSMLLAYVDSPPRYCWTSHVSPASTKTPQQSSVLDATRRSIAMRRQLVMSQPAMMTRQTPRCTTEMSRRIMRECLHITLLTCACPTAWMRWKHMWPPTQSQRVRSLLWPVEEEMRQISCHHHTLLLRVAERKAMSTVPAAMNHLFPLWPPSQRSMQSSCHTSTLEQWRLSAPCWAAASTLSCCSYRRYCSRLTTGSPAIWWNI